MNRAPHLRSGDALSGVAGEATSFCQEITASNLPARMRDAADTLEEVSALYGYKEPDHAPWDAESLRGESRTLEGP